jgi:hypothetical protein
MTVVVADEEASGRRRGVDRPPVQLMGEKEPGNAAERRDDAEQERQQASGHDQSPVTSPSESAKPLHRY